MTETTKGYEHLDYEELTRVVLGESRGDDDTMEVVFQATFNRVLDLSCRCGDHAFPDQDTEIQILRLLINHNMIDENLRLFFNVMDYKASYITLIIMTYFDTRKGHNQHSDAFAMVDNGRADDLAGFFENPMASMLMVDLYKVFKFDESLPFAPFHQDEKLCLLDQIGLDMNTYSGFKKLNFELSLVKYEGASMTEIIQALVATNAIPDYNIFPGGNPIIPTNPLFRTMAGTEVNSAYEKLQAEIYSFVLVSMTGFGMYHEEMREDVHDVLHNQYSLAGLTPAFQVALYENCGKDASFMARVLMSMYHYVTVEPEVDSNAFFVAVYTGIQYYLIHNKPQQAWPDVVKFFIQDDRILLGEVAAMLLQAEMEPDSVEDPTGAGKLN